MDKTNVMITGNEPKSIMKPNLKFGNMSLKFSDELCFLGLVLNKSGSLKTVQMTLKPKVMCAFFGLKGTVKRLPTSSIINNRLVKSSTFEFRYHVKKFTYRS